MKYDIVKLMARRKIRWKKRWVSGDSGGRLTFRSKKAGRLSDYRIYGQTSRNLFDMKKFAETASPTSAAINYSGNSLIFTATENDAYVNEVYFPSAMPPVLMPACIDVQPLTTYTITMNSPYKCYISWLNDSGVPVHRVASIPNDQSSYTFTTPENCTKLLFRLGKYVVNIGDTFTISDIMLNSGSTPLPYEPYGESVGDRTGNLFDNYPNTITNKEIIYSNVNNQYMTIVGESSGTYSQTGYATCTLPQGTYFLKWYLDNEIYNSNVFMLIRDNNDIDIVNVNANGASFTLNNEQEIKIKIGVIQSGVNINTKIYVQINSGSVPLPYEPYGYKVPVTINDVTTNLYLPEPLRKVGDEAEYIDYGEQKMHRIGADDVDLTLPALPTLPGTNVLSVGTAVQPSRVEIKGRIKAVEQETEPEPEQEPEPEPETAEAEQETAEAEQE